MRHRVWAGVVLAAAWAGTAWAQAPEGTEFRVTPGTGGEQDSPAVATDASGNFVVTWIAISGPDGDGYGIRGRRFAANTVPRTGSLGDINSYTTSDQLDPSVAADANGNFVVVWASRGQDGSYGGVFGQRFDFFGARRGGEFQVNTYTTGNQADAKVASDSAGGFVVVWHSDQDGSGSAVLGRRYDAAGVPKAAPFMVNTHTVGAQRSPSVASDAAGNFVVAWASSGQDGAGDGVFAQRFDTDGASVGSEFRVNSYTTHNQNRPSVAMNTSGAFVVAWQDYGQGAVSAQRFDASGAPQGSEFLVHGVFTAAGAVPQAGMDKQGNTVVVWVDYSASEADVFGQRYDASGLPVDGAFQVNTYTTSGQIQPAIAQSPDGDFVVVWRTYDGDGLGLSGQRYGDILFQDGFESGDFTRWSSAAVTGVGDAIVSAGAALAGTTKGMDVLVLDTTPLYVQDDTPAGESRYRARFYFGPAGFDTGETSGHHRIRICIAFDDSGERVAALVLRRVGGAYAVQARVRLDDGTRADTGFFPITDAAHFFEFDWRRASAPGAADGVFTLRIDNALASKLTGLANNARTVGYVRMGAMSLKAGAQGFLRFDQFESRRRTLIGPE